MSADKPNNDKIFQWNDTETNVIEPTASKQQNGWNPGEKAPAQHFNWLWNIVGTWTTFLNKLWERGHDGSGGDTGGIGMTGLNGNAANNPLGENSFATGTSNNIPGDNSASSGTSNYVDGIRSGGTGTANHISSDNTSFSGDGNISETGANNSSVDGQTNKNYSLHGRVSGTNNEAGDSAENPATNFAIDVHGSNNIGKKALNFLRGIGNVVNSYLGFVLNGKNSTVNAEGAGCIGTDGVTNDRYYNTTINEITISEGVYLPTETDESSRGLKSHVLVGGWDDQTQSSKIFPYIIKNVGETGQKMAARYFMSNNCLCFNPVNLESIYHFRNGSLINDELGNNTLYSVGNPISGTGLFGESSDYSFKNNDGEQAALVNTSLMTLAQQDNSFFQFWFKKTSSTNNRIIFKKLYSNGADAVSLVSSGSGQVALTVQDSDSSGLTDYFTNYLVDGEWVMFSINYRSDGIDAYMTMQSGETEVLTVNNTVDPLSSDLNNDLIIGDVETTSPSAGETANLRFFVGETLNNNSDNREKIEISAAQEHSINFYSICKPVIQVVRNNIYYSEIITENVSEDNVIIDADNKKVYVKPFLAGSNDRIFVGLM